MSYRIIFYFKALIWITVAVFTLGACDAQAPTLSPSPATTQAVPSSPQSTITEALATESPTPTYVPLVATVNGEPISLAEYQIELALFQKAIAAELTEEDETRVLDNLIEQTLLAQAALQNDFSLDEASLETRIQQLADQMGSPAALEGWILDQGYTPELFRQALTRSLLAAWMRDQITADLPLESEQILARQILVYTKAEADEVYAQLVAGNDFGNLALQYNPLTGGNLLWFPRGYLPDNKLEEAVFSLQPGEYSPVIETLAGFHVVEVLERETNRPLDADALQVIKTKALQEWLEQRRNESDIQILAP
ncbi:MAG TPA: peptidylprolyl isomerase [Anaerolineales bacterium]|nr:peptidylprolyl isomerase [Anaerolineales bacterium]